ISKWIVATLGFKVDIAAFALPLVGAAGMLSVIFTRRKKFVQFCLFLMGFGLLFVGLEFMKDSVVKIFEEFNLTRIADYPLIVFALLGVLVTAIIQSSSATVAITLSALFANAIAFESALAIVVGSEVGTTLKILIGALGGKTDKKRVALGNFIFNTATMIVAFLLLRPLSAFIQNNVGIKDNLIALVFFQSLINLVAIISFYPFIDWFTAFLQKQFSDDTTMESKYISRVSPEVPEAALEAMEKEARRFLSRVTEFNLHAFGINDTENKIPDGEKEYELLKQLEGEILAFYSTLQAEKQNPDDLGRYNQLAGSVRNGMYAAKSIKDIRHNIDELQSAADDLQHAQYKQFKKQQEQFWSWIDEQLDKEKPPGVQWLLEAWRAEREQYESFMKSLYNTADKNKIDELVISTMLNINRELHSSNKALLNTFRYLFLSVDESNEIREITDGLVQ
ncbi:MAG TPA: Na/Pi symporter, partial [Bacteroidia bacterium]|nr:Na/Pi symporter [Bacteroidia bacterium]